VFKETKETKVIRVFRVYKVALEIVEVLDMYLIILLQTRILGMVIFHITIPAYFQ
jgi:hypothetical protein